MDRRVIAPRGRRAARRRPPRVAWATVKVFDAAHAPPGATRRAADLSMVRIPSLAENHGKPSLWVFIIEWVFIIDPWY